MTAHRIYLAGPEVFRPDAEAEGERLKDLCSSWRGVSGIYPLDGEPLHEAITIKRRCMEMIDGADAVVANISPFRGYHMDPGTAFEIGYAEARGKPVHLWSDDIRDMVDRVPALIDDSDPPRRWCEAGHQVEDFAQPENLMIAAGNCVWSSPDEAIQAAVMGLRADVAARRRRLRLRLLIIALAVLAMLLAAVTIRAARADIYVIDGDTIVVDREHIRLVGLNAPETRGAKCEAERRLGYLAKARLVALLTAACGPLSRAPATCLDMAREPHKDRYGRGLARLRAGGADVAAILIREGLAEPYDCAHGHCPVRMTWCGARDGG